MHAHAEEPSALSACTLGPIRQTDLCLFAQQPLPMALGSVGTPPGSALHAQVGTASTPSKASTAVVRPDSAQRHAAGQKCVPASTASNSSSGQVQMHISAQELVPSPVQVSMHAACPEHAPAVAAHVQGCTWQHPQPCQQHAQHQPHTCSTQPLSTPHGHTCPSHHIPPHTYPPSHYLPHHTHTPHHYPTTTHLCHQPTPTASPAQLRPRLLPRAPPQTHPRWPAAWRSSCPCAATPPSGAQTWRSS